MKLYDLLFEYTSYENMVAKLQSIYILMNRGATDGERSASKSAYDRVLASISREYGESQAKAAEAKVKATGQSGASGGSTHRSRAKPKEPPKQKKRNTSGSSSQRKGNYGGENHYYHDDRTGWDFYIVRFIDPDAGKRGSDKIWGYASKNGEFMSFWGGYGKSVRTKPLSSDREAMTMLAKKAQKGYRRVDLTNNLADYAYIFNQFN